MLRTGNAGLRPREMALPEKRRGGVAPRRFKIWGFCRFLLPCFATGFHIDHFKIATAALRPRNDTKMVGFAIKPTIFISEMFEIHLAGEPCFAAGCHIDHFKIATAAGRPRNDTKLGRFYLGNGRFTFFSYFLRCRAASFFKHFVLKTVPFFQKTYRFCHCEEGACARRGNL